MRRGAGARRLSPGQHAASSLFGSGQRATGSWGGQLKPDTSGFSGVDTQWYFSCVVVLEDGGRFGHFDCEPDIVIYGKQSLLQGAGAYKEG